MKLYRFKSNLSPRTSYSYNLNGELTSSKRLYHVKNGDILLKISYFNKSEGIWTCYHFKYKVYIHVCEEYLNEF